MSALCVVDQIPATEGSLCTACSRRFAARVRRIPSLLVELDVTITKQARQVADRGASSSERSLVFNASASDAAAVLRRALQAVVWDAERGARFEFDAAAVDLVARAVAGWSSVVRGDQVLDRYEQIETAVRQATRVIDREPAREVVGSCDCGEVVKADPEAVEVICRSCGVVWETADLRETRDRKVLDLVATPTEICAFFNRAFGVKLTDNEIRRWKRRRLLTAVSETPTRRTYRVGDVVDVWEEWYGKGLPGRPTVEVA